MNQMLPKYRDKRTARFAAGERVKEFESFRVQAERRLDNLDAATSLDDLRVVAGHRLEALRGDRTGQFSIRINRQWRICFEWSEWTGQALNVEIVDYH